MLVVSPSSSDPSLLSPALSSPLQRPMKIWVSHRVRGVRNGAEQRGLTMELTEADLEGLVLEV